MRIVMPKPFAKSGASGVVRGTKRHMVAVRILAEEADVPAPEPYFYKRGQVLQRKYAVYVYVEDGKVVGFIEAGPVNAQTVAVSPAWRNRGIGGKLLKAAEKHVFLFNPKRVVVIAPQTTAPWYLQKGYRLVNARYPMLLEKCV